MRVESRDLILVSVDFQNRHVRDHSSKCKVKMKFSIEAHKVFTKSALSRSYQHIRTFRKRKHA